MKMVYNTQTVGLPVSSSQDKARYIWNLPLAFYSLGHEQQEENGIHVVCLMRRSRLMHWCSQQHQRGSSLEDNQCYHFSCSGSSKNCFPLMNTSNCPTVPVSEVPTTQEFPSITATVRLISNKSWKICRLTSRARG